MTYMHSFVTIKISQNYKNQLRSAKVIVKFKLPRCYGPPCTSDLTYTVSEFVCNDVESSTSVGVAVKLRIIQ